MFGLTPDCKTEADKLRVRISSERLETAKPRDYFIPDAALGRLLTFESVRAIIDEIGIGWEKQDEAVLSTLHHSKKIFCILVWIDGLNLKSIEEIMAGRNDTELPFAVGSVGQRFWEAQWEYLSPVFDGLYCHLSRDIILPFRSEKFIRAGNAILSKVEIYDVHQKTLGDLPNRPAGDHPVRLERAKTEVGSGKILDVITVTRRQLLTNDSSDWSSFRFGLNKLQSIGKLEHPHIASLLGAYSYMDFEYLIFPDAEMDLEQFFVLNKRHPDFLMNNSFYTSIVGLAQALNDIHKYTPTSMGYLLLTSGYHHNIKPHNILVQNGKFLFSDFGLSRVVRKSEDTRLAYHPPEYLGVATSSELGCRTDIWSFGCVLFEIASYMLLGCQGVQLFRYKRKLDHSNDCFHHLGRLKPEVSSWMEHLESKTTHNEPMSHLLKVIKTMIDHRFTERPLSSTVLADLCKAPAFQTQITPLHLKRTKDPEIDGKWWNELKREIGLRSEPVVRLLLEKKGTVDLNCPDKSGWTVLDYAATSGRRGFMVRLLLEADVRPSFSTSTLSKALLKAARHGDKSAVAQLLEHGADPNHRDTNGFTALEEAAYNGKSSVVQQILQVETHPSISMVNLSRSLCWGSRRGDEALVQLLVKKGADAKYVDEEGNTALRWAVLEGHGPVVCLLLQKGANPNHLIPNPSVVQRGEDLARYEPVAGMKTYPDYIEEITVFEEAVYNGKRPMVRLLLEKAPSLQVSSEIWLRVLHWALRCGDEELVDIVFKNGAEPNHLTAQTTALIQAVSEGHESVVRPSVESRADIEVRDPSGQTVPQVAIPKEDISTIKLLCNKGADPSNISLKDSERFQGAVRTEDEPLLNELLEEGIDPDYRPQNPLTPLERAAMNKQWSIIRFLLSNAGRKFSARTLATVLDLALIHQDLAIIQILLDNGAYSNYRNPAGYTVLDLEIIRKGPMVRELLEAAVKSGFSTADLSKTLHVAATNSDGTLVQLLIDKGAEVDYQENRITTLLMAVMHGNTAAVRVLLNGGADPLRGCHGLTPLNAASLHPASNHEIIKLLEERSNIRMYNFIPTSKIGSYRLESRIMANLRKDLTVESE